MNGDPTLTMLVHGESGTGKSWFAATAPAPRLILDAEGRAQYVPSVAPPVYWDPITQSPPRSDGSWDTCIVKVYRHDIIDKVYQWLRAGEHDFKSVILDSLMEIQKRLIDDTAGTNIMKTQDWGTVLRQLEKMVRDFRDLVHQPALATDVVVLVSGTNIDENNTRRPLLQGQLKMTLPYFIDVVGYLYVAPNTDGQGFTRQLLVSPTPYAVAKDGTGKLGNFPIPDPNVTTMYGWLTPPIVTEPAPVPTEPQVAATEVADPSLAQPMAPATTE